MKLHGVDEHTEVYKLNYCCLGKKLNKNIAIFEKPALAKIA